MHNLEVIVNNTVLYTYKIFFPEVHFNLLKIFLKYSCFTMLCSFYYKARYINHVYIGASLVAQRVKNLPTMQETQETIKGYPDNPGQAPSFKILI